MVSFPSMALFSRYLNGCSSFLFIYLGHMPLNSFSRTKFLFSNATTQMAHFSTFSFQSVQMCHYITSNTHTHIMSNHKEKLKHKLKQKLKQSQLKLLYFNIKVNVTKFLKICTVFLYRSVYFESWISGCQFKSIDTQDFSFHTLTKYTTPFPKLTFIKKTWHCWEQKQFIDFWIEWQQMQTLCNINLEINIHLEFDPCTGFLFDMGLMKIKFIYK